jgi:hypothetical protein
VISSCQLMVERVPMDLAAYEQRILTGNPDRQS